MPFQRRTDAIASRAAAMLFTARFHSRKLFITRPFSRFSSRFVLPSMVSEAEGASSAASKAALTAAASALSPIVSIIMVQSVCLWSLASAPLKLRASLVQNAQTS